MKFTQTYKGSQTYRSEDGKWYIRRLYGYWYIYEEAKRCGEATTLKEAKAKIEERLKEREEQ